MSSMAGSVVKFVRALPVCTNPESAECSQSILVTTLATLSSATALLGIALIITGRLRLASLVQYLPLPVIGSPISPPIQTPQLLPLPTKREVAMCHLLTCVRFI